MVEVSEVIITVYVQSNVISCFVSMKDWSPECVRIPTGPPADWGIEEVIQYITATDPALKAYAELFRTHVMSHAALSPFHNLFNAFLFPGNRWQSFSTAELGHDDEIYGTEVGASLKNLQSC